MCSVFDNEEVGSGTKQGAGSTFGADVLKYNVAQKYTTDARSAAPEKAAYIYAGQISSAGKGSLHLCGADQR